MIKSYIVLNTALICLLLISTTIKAQIPSNDPSSWSLQSAANGTEEFNSSLDFVSSWFDQYPNNGFYSNGAERNIPANLIQTGTTLKIKADTLVPNYYEASPPYPYGTPDLTFAYQGGALWRRRDINDVDIYKFGYIEILAQFPTGSYSLWPAFWLWMSDCTYPSPYYYNEIDIAENYPDASYAGNVIGTNTWLGCPAIDNPEDINVGFTVSSAFHKYAVEWAPDRIIWYIDDNPVRTIYDASGVLVPQHPMAVILNFAIGPSEAYLPSNWDNTAYFTNSPLEPTNWPKYFEIDYLRYYKLGTDCSTNIANLCSPGSYDRNVKKLITTGNPAGGCTPNFNPSNASGSYTLRATDYITIDAGTTIDPSGTGSFFAVQTMACPN